MPTRRREFIKGVAATGTAVGVAGCGGSGDGGDGGGDGGDGGDGDGGDGGDGGGETPQDTASPEPDVEYEAVEPVEWLTLSRGDNPTYYQEAQQAKRMLEELGFQFNESVHEAGQWVDTLFAKDYDMANIGWSNTPERLFPYYNLFFSFHSQYTGEGGGNFSEWGHDEYDSTVESFTSSMNVDDRVQFAKDCQELLAKNVPVAYMTNPPVFVAHNESLYTGWERMLGGFAYFNPISMMTASRQTSESVMVAASVQPPEQFPNFMSHTGPVAQFLFKFNYDPLIQLDTQGAPVEEGAAESWEVVDDTTIDVTLREGMTWHDGESVTPEDVTFTWDYAKDNGITYLASDIDPYESSEILDSRSVRFNLNQPFAGFIPVSMYRLPILPQHVWDGVAEEQGVDHPGQWQDPDTTGSGVFELTNYEPGNRIVYEKHTDHYNADRYDFDTLIYNIYGTNTAAVGDVINGNAAFVEEIGYSDWQRADNASGVVADTNPSIQVNGIFINTNRAPFNDVLVRQAVAYGLNRQQIIDTVHQGYGQVAKSPIAPANERYFNAEVEAYDFSLEQARQKLREAGFRYQNGNLMKPVDWSPTTEFIGLDG